MPERLVYLGSMLCLLRCCTREMDTEWVTHEDRRRVVQLKR